MMSTGLLTAVLILAGLVLLVGIVLYFRKSSFDPSSLEEAVRSLEKAHERTERLIQLEIAKNREEVAGALRESREELASSLKNMGDTQGQLLSSLIQTNDQKLDRLRESVEQKLQAIQADSAGKLDQVRQDSHLSSKTMREEVSLTVRNFTDTLTAHISEMSRLQGEKLTAFGERLEKLTQSNEAKLDLLKGAVEEKLRHIQEDNSKQLESMRATVDEKLQGTLDKRLGESFKQVSDRLEQVYKGLGEMQALATGVGDLKKVLTNVKTRGTWGEVQLWAMLEQILNPDQYEANVATKGGAERVEFAIRLPGRSGDRDDVVWLPIDAKFPVEDYQRLVEAQERADADGAEAASKGLETRIKQCAWDICDKYLNPPATTDFGILFLPTEGLFAEVIRRPGLAEYVQRECKVVLAGPTTLWSVLNSLQMGFRTLAIEKRSSEVWNLLAAVKTEWSKYGEVLAKVQKKLHEATDTLDKAQVRTRAIGRKLKDVQELPAADADGLLLLKSDNDATEEEEVEEAV
jgi:DNA recombination protein RmuC